MSNKQMSILVCAVSLASVPRTMAQCPDTTAGDFLPLPNILLTEVRELLPEHPRSLVRPHEQFAQH